MSEHAHLLSPAESRGWLTMGWLRPGWYGASSALFSNVIIEIVSLGAGFLI